MFSFARCVVGLFLVLVSSAAGDDLCPVANENFRVQLHGETMFEVNRSGSCICAAYRGGGAGFDLADNPTVQAMHAQIDLLKAQVQNLTSLLSPHSASSGSGTTSSGMTSTGMTSTGTTSMGTVPANEPGLYAWGGNDNDELGDGTTIRRQR
eukprot:TRINITY_DN5442_c0_g1_i1.p1 TRINITY_DN5442_c0_g1~~TRINITY_DN5442_c0_g1_i1.p1  ORF type:complete len:152 (-),score=34.46 TRINITY_DN5442_c0_g1_i1:36-491(-)